jgi:hypothetical protein
VQLAIRVEESDYLPGLLEGLNQTLQENAVKTPIAEPDVILVMLVRGVHGYLQCGEIPGTQRHGRLLFYEQEWISRAKILAS